ncbi:MAG: hypothetical protein BGO90_06030 [Legionella sp. 40-6]|nr:DUF177 domain-containing protein [Legionella sp.]OJY36686.1 MAG: hypothetical protein BGO90_06030 [Legionella sp. 40-6]
MLNLKEEVKKGNQTTKLKIDARLPPFIEKPVELDVDFTVTPAQNFYVMDLRVKGRLDVQCQRCLEYFVHSYDNATRIAICSNDEQAEKLQNEYECVVADGFLIELEELVADELHLYAPTFHETVSLCSQEINTFLSEKSAED